MFLTSMGWARPVSYVGGTTLSMLHHGDKTRAVLHFTPVRFWSVGYRYEHRNARQIDSHSLQSNFLILRLNEPHSQANIYLQSSVGFSSEAELAEDLTGDLGMMLDWEDRRFLISYQNRYTWYPRAPDLLEHSARLGVAPYIGDYGDVHTWLMLQVDQDNLDGDAWLFTPLVRLLYSVNLFEVGYSLKGDWLFNYTLRL